MSASAGQLVPCAIVAAGTSRFVVVAGTDQGLARRAAVDLIRAGLGGESYQLNKAVIVPLPTASTTPLDFRFLQVDEASGYVRPVPDCLNAGVAAALYMLSVGATVDPTGCFMVRNRETGQVLRLRPPPRLFTGSWLIRYCSLASFDPVEMRAHPATAAWLVHAGNVVVLAKLSDSTDVASALHLLEMAGLDAARAAGIDNEHARELKIILYHGEAVSTNETTVEARQYYRGQLHRSIAGSGALVLARHLAERLRMASTTPPATVVVTVRHPSGSTPVRVGYPSRSSAGHWAELNTSARLLVAGRAPIYR
jgi:hypothetical protein